MRSPASGIYTVAWFKLADFIARGEKERALMVHKLLMHSVQDEAIPYQLEGDILLAFDDDAAIDRYHIAANIYKKSGKIKQAASVYEHVLLYKEDEHVLEALFSVYVYARYEQATLDTFSRLVKVCLSRQNFQMIAQLFHRCLSENQDPIQGLLGIRLVRALLVYDQTHADIEFYLQQTIALLKQHEQYEQLAQFLGVLQGLQEPWYDRAKMYL